MINPLRIITLVLALVILSPIAQADVKLPTILNSHMVLQQGMPAPIWGWADAGEKITVKFAGQTKTTTANDKGKWLVKLDALKASAKPRTLTISAKNQIKLTDVLVGEVWICSGQSNMEWPIRASKNPKQEAANANYPNIRIYNVVGHPKSYTPVDHCNGLWTAVTPKSIPNFSAVGYFFGRRLHKELKTPIGLVGSNWGGTRIEPWTTIDGFDSVPETKPLAERARKLAASGSKRVNHQETTAICNAMILPLAPYAMRGAIWYQGESNGGEHMSYYYKKKALVNGWRKLFNPNLGFYWVQLANFRNPNDKPQGGDGWARIREAQLKALDIPHTGMAVITDIGEARDIHPRNKQDVGSRLAQWALYQTYKKTNLVPSGPLYKSQKIEGGKIRLSFNHIGKGLMVGKKTGLAPTAEVKDGKLAHFAIAGADKKWHWADAVIDGNTVVVSSSAVKNPVAVRYAFSMNPNTANLYNKDGLPASPFRTDNW